MSRRALGLPREGRVMTSPREISVAAMSARLKAARVPGATWSTSRPWDWQERMREARPEG